MSIPRSAYPEGKWTVWARSFGTLLVGVAGLWVSYSVANIQKDSQMRNSAQDLALKHESLDHQRKTDEARLAASLLPFLKCNDDVQRASALDVLSTSAPGYGARFSQLLLEKCGGLPVSVRTEVSKVQEQSLVQQRTTEFITRIENARDYENHGHDGPAARLFEEASTLLPSVYASRVNKEEIERAKRAFGAGNFKEAADRFELAFRAVP